MNVLVMGSGAVGSYYGAILAKSGHTVNFVVRGDHFRAIKAQGLTVESQDAKAYTIKVNISHKPDPTIPFDLILFTVKAYDTHDAVKSMLGSISDNTSILTLQNGFESGQEIQSLIQKGTVLEGPAYTVCTIRSPGVVQQIGNVNSLLLGPVDPKDLDKAGTLTKQLSDSGWPIELTNFPQRELWSKLVFLGPLAGLTSIVPLTAGEIRANAHTLKTIEDMMGEYAAVGNVCGANLASDVVGQSIKTLHRYPANGSTSMAKDWNSGKKTEIEALLGSVIRKAKDHRIDMPITSSIYGLLTSTARINK